jgi:hypothetical protein
MEKLTQTDESHGGAIVSNPKEKAPKWHEAAKAKALEWLESHSKRYMWNYAVESRYKVVECYTVVMKDDNDDETIPVMFSYSKENRILRVFRSMESQKF